MLDTGERRTCVKVRILDLFDKIADNSKYGNSHPISLATDVICTQFEICLSMVPSERLCFDTTEFMLQNQTLKFTVLKYKRLN